MFKARGSQQQMILFPMERGRNTLVVGLLNFKFNLSDPFIRHFLY
jgi:hypothetical protein